jgi:NADH dehydrogenase/NADH:ubiquinone oxidoreductase subunit G
MGALTPKTFPFNIHQWDLKKIENVEPTDGFGSNSRILKNNNKIILIEPSYNYNIHTFNTWLTDKGDSFLMVFIILGIQKKVLQELIKHV